MLKGVLYAWHKLVSKALCRRAERESMFFLTDHLLILCLQNTWGVLILHLLSLGSTNPPCASDSHRTTGCLTLALHEPELNWLRPHCGLTMGDKSHLKEGKQWENRQEKTSLVGSLQNMDILRETLHLTSLLLPKSNNWTLLTDVALGLMFCCFCSCHTV